MDQEILIQESKSKGTWLTCSFRIHQNNALYTKDWNNCGAILRVLEPEHTLSEKDARVELLSRIDAHANTLKWPAFLMTADEFKPTAGVELSHPLTTFVALAKSTGSVWMKDREPRLAPLHSPTAVAQGSTGHGVYIQWKAGLFFPKGLPPDLFRAVKGEYEQALQAEKRELARARVKASDKAGDQERDTKKVNEKDNANAIWPSRAFNNLTRVRATQSGGISR
jgi:hypothetical protein